MEFTETGDRWPPKAYKNDAYLNSREARKIRVLCEMSEPEDRFRKQNIEDTLVFFGSARSVTTEEAKRRHAAAEAAVAASDSPSEDALAALEKANNLVRLAPYHDAAIELSREMTVWSKNLPTHDHRFIVCTGGGPGMMEAANQGAKEAGGASIGLGISLPFEQGLNEFVTHDLSFEFHYFFVRKYWFAYWAKALVVFPGGFGTMDELFELMTLVQTGKISKKMPIVLYGREFWNDILNFEAYVKWGVVSPKDLKLFTICDSVEEARDYLVNELTRLYLQPTNS